MRCRKKTGQFDRFQGSQDGQRDPGSSNPDTLRHFTENRGKITRCVWLKISQVSCNIDLVIIIKMTNTPIYSSNPDSFRHPDEDRTWLRGRFSALIPERGMAYRNLGLGGASDTFGGVQGGRFARFRRRTQIWLILMSQNVSKCLGPHEFHQRKAWKVQR